MSDGRLVAGFAVGGGQEMYNYNISPSVAREQYWEAIDLIERAWTEDGPFRFEGKYYPTRYVNPWPKPLQQPRPPIFMSGLRDPLRSAKRITKYDLDGWIGIQDSPTGLARWLTAIDQQFEEIGSSKRSKDLEICSMIWTVITDEETDQTDNGVPTNLLVGTAGQLTDRLKAYKEAGLTMPLIWPPFTDVPVSKTLDDLKRIKNDIMPKVDAV
jgi:alkanesulfonate monooxygenase SsuD/methylene tetrahydromethanopterin reductase-like flavin-dependent oxidoreductase (luciferase family)